MQLARKAAQVGDEALAKHRPTSRPCCYVGCSK